MRMLSNFKTKILLTVSAVISLSLTCFIFVSSYEVVSGEDIKYSPSIVKFSLSTSIDAISQTLTDSSTSSNEIIETYHRPQRIIFPSQNLKIDLLPVLKNESGYLTRQGKAHYLTFSEHPESGLGDSIIYFTSAWNTVFNPQNIKAGNFIQIETANYTSIYRVVNMITLRSDEQPIFPKLNKPTILVVINSNDQSATFIQAIFAARKEEN